MIRDLFKHNLEYVHRNVIAVFFQTGKCEIKNVKRLINFMNVAVKPTIQLFFSNPNIENTQRAYVYYSVKRASEVLFGKVTM